nr:hypothetical protein BaRGS_010087 [Batillaria attramentaria]
MAFKEGCLVVSLVGMLPWQNPEDLVSSEVRRILYRFQVGLLAFLCFIGTPLSSLNMAVFYKQGLELA